MTEPDLYCAACDAPTDREVTEVFENPKLPEITFPLCEECDATEGDN